MKWKNQFLIHVNLILNPNILYLNIYNTKCNLSIYDAGIEVPNDNTGS